MMKKIISFIAVLLFANITLNCNAQSYNNEQVALTNFIIRMYNNAPFEGVRVVVDYKTKYLISVLMLDKTKYSTPSALNRVASVKAMSQASRYFSGSSISSDIIIRTSEKSDSTSCTEIIENIKEHSIGYVKSLEQLTNFPKGDNKVVFIFFKRLDK